MSERRRIADALPTNPRNSIGGGAVVTLHWVAKRIGLHEKSRSNWTPMLKMLCGQHGIDVRDDDCGVASCRVADVPRIKAIVERHFKRPRYSNSAKRVTNTEQGK
jgi:hypothetical protein